MIDLDTLNAPQREAVQHTEGPLLVLAGAGSGKTRVLTHRIAYLIEEKGVNPWNILAITFTNKAAGEMRERVDRIVGYGAESIWVSTFHSACVRILRRHIDLLGYDTSFTIYDTDDQKTLMKDICKHLNVDTKIYKERNLMSAISSAKNEMITPEEFKVRAEGDFGRQKIASVYEEYEKQMRANNALDFDDLLLKTVQLFQTQAEVLDYYQERFRYIMVDEYQDTNTVQFWFVRLLAGKYRNLCVVGDDDQSIYKFRGANIKNILDYEQVFEDAKVIKLEQNYRSTGNILNAANTVIRHNRGRKDKTLWTDNGEGEKIGLRQFDSGYDEAEYIVDDIRKQVNEGTAACHDFAILYRTNAQSRVFEEKFVTANIPYRIVGGINFYARREIKDVLAYLKTIDNAKDDIAVRRIVNVPKRGIGLTSINRVQELAAVIEEFSRQMEQVTDITEEWEPAVKKLFKRHHMLVDKMLVLEYENKQREAYLTLRTTHGACLTAKEAAGLFGQAMGKYQWNPARDSKAIVTRKSSVLRFVEESKYQMMYGISGIPKAGERVSGDHYTFFKNLEGQAIMSLADGMGSGEQASRESGKIIELTEQLMEAGFAARSSLKLVNTVLLLAGKEQHPAAVDVICVDLNTGVLEAMKLGAVASFVMGQDGVMLLEAGDVPIGILNPIEPVLLSRKLWDDDRIIMVSDGVLDAMPGEEKEAVMKEFLVSLPPGRPQDMAEQIMEFALSFTEGARDDMTVLVAGIWERR